MYHLSKCCLALTAKTSLAVFPRAFPAVAQKQYNLVFTRNYKKPVEKKVPHFWPEDTLVKLGESSSTRNIFFVHGIEGHVENLKNFGALISTSIQPYGLQLSPELQTHCIEVIAGQYIEAIWDIQPKGPYNIGAYSSGGPIALEIISQFEQKLDEKVTNLVLLDAFLQIELSKVDMVTKIKEFAAANLAEYEKTGDCIGWENRLSMLDPSKLHRENIDVFLGYFKRLVPMDLYRSVKSYFDRYMAVGFLSAIYQPQYEFSVNTILITPTDQKTLSIGDDNANELLEKVCKVPPLVIQVDGDHQSFLVNQASLSLTAQAVTNFLETNPDPIPEPVPEVKEEAEEQQAATGTS